MRISILTAAVARSCGLARTVGGNRPTGQDSIATDSDSGSSTWMWCNQLLSSGVVSCVSTPEAMLSTPAPAFNRADKLRLRLCGGRLLLHPPEQFQAAAVKRRRSLTDGDSIASEIALIHTQAWPFRDRGALGVLAAKVGTAPNGHVQDTDAKRGGRSLPLKS